MFALGSDGLTLGREELNLFLGIQSASCYRLHHSPIAPLRIGAHRSARYPPHPMAAPFTVLIMAAGQGTRMRSDTPKVLHRLAGKPLVGWVIDAAREAGAERVVAVVRPGDGVAEGLPDGVEVAEQVEGEGTGAAVLAARDVVLGQAAGPVVVLSG